ncbi:MAG: alpha/beta fold hydrolase [Actinomycetales bacterium]|nr:alpha/beta fold hydrolase [Actinomycetales bacterium]
MAHPPAPVDREPATFVDAEGVTIHYYRWRAAAPRAVVQILHGIGEHALRYEELAQALVAAGYTVYADDHRGHGETWREQWHGDPAKLGRLGVGGVRATVAGLRRFARIIREAEPGLPLVLLGHSMGAIFGQKLIDADSRDWDAVVFSGAAYRTLTDMNAGDLNKRHAAEGETGYEWLSRDRAVVAAAAADPLMTVATTMKLFGLADSLRLLGTPKPLATDPPMLIQVGEDDTLGGPRSVEKLARAYRERGGLHDVEVKVYPGARHEVYNETNRAEVRADLIAWLDAHVG